MTKRRDLLARGAAGLAAWSAGIAAGQAPAAPGKTIRVGVISPAKHAINAHTWHFAQYLHPACDFDALQKHYPRGVPTTAAVGAACLASCRATSTPALADKMFRENARKLPRI